MGFVVIFKQDGSYLDTLSISEQYWSFDAVNKLLSEWMNFFHWDRVMKMYHHSTNIERDIKNDSDLKDISVVQVHVSCNH